MLASLGPIPAAQRTVRFGIVTKPSATVFTPEAERRLMTLTAQQYDVDPQLLPQPKSREEAKAVPSACGAFYMPYFHELVYDRARIHVMQRADTLPHETTHSILALARTQQQHREPREYRRQKTDVVWQFWQDFVSPETLTVNDIDNNGHALTVTPVVTPYIPTEQSRRRLGLMIRHGLPSSPIKLLEALPDYFDPFMVRGMNVPDQVRMPLFQFGVDQLKAFAEAQYVIALAAMRSNTVPLSYIPTLPKKPFCPKADRHAKLALSTQPYTLLTNLSLSAPIGLSSSTSSRIIRYMMGNHEEFLAHQQGFRSLLTYTEELMRQPDGKNADELALLKTRLKNDLRLLELGKQLCAVADLIRRLPRKPVVEKQRVGLHFEIERQKKELYVKAGHISHNAKLGSLGESVRERMQTLAPLISQYVEITDPDTLYEDSPFKQGLLKQAEDITHAMRRLISHSTNNSLKHAPFLYTTWGEYQKFQQSFTALGLNEAITKDSQRYPHVDHVISGAIEKAYQRHYGTSYKLAL